jgi:starvation-inducible outer membrane lipoprotein
MGHATMKNAARLAVLGLFAFTLAACATQPQADLTPPPAKRLDAKTTLENHR